MPEAHNAPSSAHPRTPAPETGRLVRALPRKSWIKVGCASMLLIMPAVDPKSRSAVTFFVLCVSFQFGHHCQSNSSSLLRPLRLLFIISRCVLLLFYVVRPVVPSCLLCARCCACFTVGLCCVFPTSSAQKSTVFPLRAPSQTSPAARNHLHLPVAVDFCASKPLRSRTRPSNEPLQPVSHSPSASRWQFVPCWRPSPNNPGPVQPRPSYFPDADEPL